MVFKNKLFQDIFGIVTANLDAISQQSIHLQMALANLSLLMACMISYRLALKLSWENEKPARP
jgi:hypothetical protein